MTLTLETVMPNPLTEKILKHSSDIWNKQISFGKNEWVFVQAPSGTGKTTLVHTLYGIRQDHSGLVKWDNIAIEKMHREDLAKLRTNNLSVIFQDMRLFPALTAWENIEVKRQLTNTVTEAQVTNWMEQLGIAHKKNASGATLSYGEQQRVAIIRALVQPYRWLLMDEPFSHLDNENTVRAIQLIADVTKQNNAAMLLADLDDNNHFTYTKKHLL